MLAKRTSKDQLTLPKAVVQVFGGADYFEVAVENGRIIVLRAAHAYERLG